MPWRSVRCNNLVPQKRVFSAILRFETRVFAARTRASKRGSAENCKVFVPDPWAFNELAHPGSKNEILELPRYLAKNYTSLSKTRVLGLLIKFLARSVFTAGASVLMQATKLLTRGIVKFGPKNFVFICVFEFINTAIFCRVLKNTKADFNQYPVSISIFTIAYPSYSLMPMVW